MRVSEAPPTARIGAHTSPSFSATVRVRLDDHPGAFAQLAQAIADAGASLGAIDIVRVERATKVRDVTVLAANDDHLHDVVEAIRAVPGQEVLQVSDRTCGRATSCRWSTRRAWPACRRQSRAIRKRRGT
jgi:hypothetical protein